MSSSLARCSNELLKNTSFFMRYVTVRTKKKGNPTMGKTRNPKSYGIKKNHGQFVHQNEILVNQSSLRFYPGQNVDIDRSNRLIALTDGTVIISCETLNPYPDSPLYGPVQSGMVVKKKFFNIIPLTLKGKFRLVSEN